MRREDLTDFVTCYNPENRHERQATWSEATPEGRWRRYSREELLARDKASLDVFWLRDDAMADLDDLPEPDVLAEEIVENLQAALASFEAVAVEARPSGGACADTTPFADQSPFAKQGSLD